MKKLFFIIFLMVFSFAITANAKKPKVVWPKAFLVHDAVGHAHTADIFMVFCVVLGGDLTGGQVDAHATTRGIIIIFFSYRY